MSAALFLALAWPLALALAPLLPGLRARALWCLPLAPLPGLWVALAGIAGPAEAPWLLLGVTLEVTPAGRLMLGVTAALWLAAGLHAAATMAGRSAAFAGFWCLTLAGNLGVFLAADVATFYVAFAAVSLAAYALVIHDGTETALRAGRVYLVMAVAGEACLLMGLLIGVAAAGGALDLAAVRAGLAGGGLGPLGLGLVILGFGIKAGLVPLHVWLPLAHPAAPVAASAALSGAIVKAGVFGVLVLVPDAATAGELLLWLGFAGAFAAALYGLTQANPKAVLAYSTVSQMGLVLAVIAAAMLAGGPRGAAVFYAGHHGLAKAALFLAVGAVAVAGRGRGLAIGLAALAALSVAGAPLTGGALVKAAAKGALPAPAALALTLSGATTTLLLLHFLRCLAQTTPARPVPAPGWALPLGAMTAAALLLPWVLWTGWSGLPADYPLRPQTLIDAAWPVLAGLAAGLLLMRFGPSARPELPQGDLLQPLLSLAAWLGARCPALPHLPPPPRRQAAALLHRLDAAASRTEGALMLWRWSGLLLLALLLALAVTAGWAGGGD